jgi:hypothetical protein
MRNVAIGITIHHFVFFTFHFSFIFKPCLNNRNSLHGGVSSAPAPLRSLFHGSNAWRRSEPERPRMRRADGWFAFVPHWDYMRRICFPNNLAKSIL